MKPFLLPLSLLAILHLGWAQDIVLKATFQGPYQNRGSNCKIITPIDVNEDGILEIPIINDNIGFRLQDINNYQMFRPFPNPNPNQHVFYYYPDESFDFTTAMCRRPGVGEWVAQSIVVDGNVLIKDIASDDVLTEVTYYPNDWGNPEIIVFDYLIK